MRSFAFGVLAMVLGVSLIPTSALAKACRDDAAVVSAQAAASAECNCAGAANRGAYVSCVGEVARARAAAGVLARECQSEVLTCALRSSCGTKKVVCCRVGRDGVTRCTLEADGENCDCLGPDDACGATGSPDGSFVCGSTTTAPPTTVTTSSTTTSTAAPTTSTTGTPTSTTAAPTTSSTAAPTTSSTSSTEVATTSSTSSTEAPTTTTLIGSPNAAFIDG